jgi:integrase
MKFDVRTVAEAALPPGKTDHIEWDDDLPGFGLRLRAGGNRSWVAQYRTADGRTRRTSIAIVAKLSPADARQAARKILAKVALGHDPQGEKAAQRQQAVRTVRALIAAYLEAKQPELRPESFRVTKLYLTGPYFKALQVLAVIAVTRSDVAAAIRAIVRNHSTATAAAARRALSAFFAWCIAEGELANGANPVDGSHRPADPTPRDRVLTDAELVEIWKAACQDDEPGKIIRLLILLGSRRQEIGGMRWSELDLDAGTWTLPAERSKNRRAHTITLPPAALAIINSVPRTSRDHLFGDRAADGFTAWSNAKADLDRRLGDAVKGWRLHDLRRSAATKMADIGIEPHVIEACLNHYSGHRAGVAGVYNRARYEQATKLALVKWADHVLALAECRAPAENVVSLHR